MAVRMRTHLARPLPLLPVRLVVILLFLALVVLCISSLKFSVVIVILHLDILTVHLLLLDFLLLLLLLLGFLLVTLERC